MIGVIDKIESAIKLPDGYKIVRKCFGDTQNTYGHTFSIPCGGIVARIYVVVNTASSLGSVTIKDKDTGNTIFNTDTTHISNSTLKAYSSLETGGYNNSGNYIAFNPYMDINTLEIKVGLVTSSASVCGGYVDIITKA